MTAPLKATLFAAILTAGSLVAVAQAQTTPATPGATTPTAPSTMGATTSSPATSSAAPAHSAAPAAVATTAAPSRTTAAPVAGANSFTQGEARRRIQDKGFGQVANLKKDDKGVWRGTATKDGKSMAVALDYQGNIVSH